MKFIIKVLYVTVGMIALIVGTINLSLPGFPTVPFYLLAQYCFLRGSKRLHTMMRNNRYIGPILCDWEDRRAIATKYKVQAIAMLSASLVYMFFKVDSALVLTIATPCAIGMSWYIATRNNPNKKSGSLA